MNRIVVTGKVWEDPQLTMAKGNIPYCKFNVSSRESVQGGEMHYDTFRCMAWRGKAELIEKYCKKGSIVTISGRMVNKEFVDNTGAKKWYWELEVDSIEFGGKAEVPAGESKEPQPNKSRDVFGVDEDGGFPFGF